MKRLRIKLTAFNTLITGTILLCLTALCLGISEESGRAEAFQNFGTQLATAATYLQGQERVRMQWFSQLEAAGNLHAAVTDGGYPLFSVGFDPERTGSAADMARVIAAREYGMPKGNQSFLCVFSMTAEDGTDYFAAVAKIPKGGQRPGADATAAPGRSGAAVCTPAIACWPGCCRGGGAAGCLFLELHGPGAASCGREQTAADPVYCRGLP